MATSKNILAASLLCLGISLCAMDSSSSSSSSSQQTPLIPISWENLLNHPLGELRYIFTLAGEEFSEQKKDAFKLISELTARRFKHPALVLDAVNYNETQIATVCCDKKTRVFDLKSGKLTHEFFGDDIVNVVAFNHAGTQLAQARNNRIDIFDFVSDKEHIDTFVHPNLVYSAAFNHEDTQLITKCCDGKTRIFDLASKKKISEVPTSYDRDPVKPGDARIKITRTCKHNTLVSVFFQQKIYEIVHSMSLAHYHLLKAFQTAVLSKKQIHADKTQWQTWESLQHLLPEISIKRLKWFIIDSSVQAPAMKRLKRKLL